MVVIVTVETLLLLLLTLLVAGLLRSHAEILRAIHSSDDEHWSPSNDVGTEALERSRLTQGVDISGETLTRERVTVSIVSSGIDTLLAFLGSGCSMCEPIWDALRSGEDRPRDVRIIVIAKDRREESMSRLRKRVPGDLPVVLSTSTWEEYRVPGSPYFVYVDGVGRIQGEGSADSWSRALSLFRDANADATLEVEGSRGEGSLGMTLVAVAPPNVVEATMAESSEVRDG